jgi:CheY-like chemotaxis protein
MATEDRSMDFGPRVLLVEDDPAHAFIAVTVIRQVLGEGCEVVVAETADEAMGVIRHFTEQDRPDLMLVDLRLPDKGGFAVLSAARAHEPSAQVPVFVITSSLYDRDIAQSYELGASVVLSKPLSRARLKEELARIGALPPLSGAMQSKVFTH